MDLKKLKDNSLHNLKEIFKKYHYWNYKNTFLLIISLIIFCYFANSPQLYYLVKKMGTLGFLGAFLAGILFVSAFTVAPALVILFDLAKMLNPILVAICAGAGSVVGDYFIFRILKDKIFEELIPLFQKIKAPFIKKIFLTPYFSWIIPIVGALMIASPLPDEVGLGMLGLSKIKIWQFVLISFLLNAIGILLVIVITGLF